MTTKKKDSKTKASASEQMSGVQGIVPTQITTVEELKTHLNCIRDKMSEGLAAPIYAVTAMNQLLNEPVIYKLLTEETKELARDIWLRLKHAGLQLRNPPILFGMEANTEV